MAVAERYRQLAQLCRERAELRRHPEDREIMLGAAAEFERMAREAEGKADAPPTRFDKS